MVNQTQVIERLETRESVNSRIWMMFVILLVWLGFMTTPCWAAQSGQIRITDQQINDMVEKTILTDSALPNHQIDVVTNEGIVTLGGTVNTLMVKERAAMLAKTIRGVRGVVNNITLQLSGLPDAALRENVVSALRYDAATDSYEIESEVKDGVVTLSGAVRSVHEKKLAVHVAKEVRGVKDVIDNLTVKNFGERLDSDMANEVKRIIAIDVWLDSSTIIVDVKNSIVTLSGGVGSSAQYDRAVSRAWTTGVKEVHAEGLKVESWGRKEDQRRDMIADRSDPEIKKAVHDAFLYDPRVLSFNPVINVDQGVVTLSGMVDNLRAKQAAGQDAQNTVGVWHIRNLLKVRPVQVLNDDKIMQNIKSALLRDSAVDSQLIEVRAKSGVVGLSGFVDSYYEKAQVENIASRANGVVDVRNAIVVNYPTSIYYNTGHDLDWNLPSFFKIPAVHDASSPYVSDAAIQHEIEAELFWSPYVDQYQVTVKVNYGVATLTGKVDSWFEYEMATENAYKGGARQVSNNIVVKEAKK